MADRESVGTDPFEVWLDTSRRFFEADSMSDSLREKCAGLFAAWARFAQAYAEAGAAAGGADVPRGGPFDPVTWLDAAGAGGWGDLWRWFGSGEGADLWQAESDAITASRQWLAYIAALERYRAAMSTGWINAFERFAAELAKEREAGEGLPPWEVIQSRWQAAADAELAAAQRSEAFLAAQRDLIRARLDCSALLAKRIEGLSELLGLPTRAELDALHQKMHRLGRDMRALRTRLEEAERRQAVRGNEP
jgi:hypothetical protein